LELGDEVINSFFVFSVAEELEDATELDLAIGDTVVLQRPLIVCLESDQELLTLFIQLIETWGFCHKDRLDSSLSFWAKLAY